jgi:hypothetical protein
MKTIFALIVGLMTTPSYAQEEIILSGQEAKTLYLSLRDIDELPARFYSLKKTVSDLECRNFRQGPRYQETTICRLDNIWLVDREDVIIEGAKKIFDSLLIDSEVDGSNPPVLTKRAPVTCLLKSPTFEPQQQHPESFECKIFFKFPYH